MTSSDVVVTFSATPSDGELEISYQVENRRAAAIWIFDVTLARKERAWIKAPDRVVVSRGDPGQARLVFGFLPTSSQMPEVEQGVATELPPGVRSLAAGARASGKVRVKLPLQPWHQYLRMARLVEPKRIVVAVGYLVDDPPWTTSDKLPADVRVPDISFVKRHQLWAVADEQALP